MKARVIETGEIIEVKSLYTPVWSRLDCNGKICEEYYEDELEFIETRTSDDLEEAARKWEDKIYLEKGYQDSCGTPHAPFSEIGNAFIAGSEWRDSNPRKGMVNIDKVCEYLDLYCRPFVLTSKDIADLKEAMLKEA